MPVKNGRSRSGFGARQLAFLSLAGAALLSLTFVVGMLVGRQWGREPSPPDQTERGKRSALTARGGLRESKAERTDQLQEKLTFYQTLTAPLAAAPSAASKPAAKSPAPPKPAAKLPEPPKISDGASGSAPITPSDDQRAPAPSGATTARGSEAKAAPSDGPAAPGSAGRPIWTVQVGAYRARHLAEELQRSLRAAGHDAYVTTGAFDDGRVHYRVRVGSFADRSQAERTAERLKSERSLVPFVTQK